MLDQGSLACLFTGRRNTPQTQVQPRYLLKSKHNALSQSSLVLLYPNWQEHTCSNTTLTGLPCFPRVDNMSDSPGVNWAVLRVWQKWYKTQPCTSCYYLHTKHFCFPSELKSPQTAQTNRAQWSGKQQQIACVKATCMNAPLGSEEMFHH